MRPSTYGNSDRLLFFFERSYCRFMALGRTELATIRNLLREADLILATTDLPEGCAVPRIAAFRCRAD
jgi:hypothetical protein